MVQKLEVSNKINFFRTGSLLISRLKNKQSIEQGFVKPGLSGKCGRNRGKPRGGPHDECHSHVHRWSPADLCRQIVGLPPFIVISLDRRPLVFHFDCRLLWTSRASIQASNFNFGCTKSTHQLWFVTLNHVSLNIDDRKGLVPTTEDLMIRSTVYKAIFKITFSPHRYLHIASPNPLLW